MGRGSTKRGGEGAGGEGPVRRIRQYTPEERQRAVEAFLEASGFTSAEIRAFWGRGISVVLANAEHERITATLRRTLIYGQRHGVEEVRVMGAYREVGLSHVADSFLQSVDAAVRVRNAATGH